MDMVTRFRESVEDDRLFHQELTILSLTEEVCRRMNEQGVSRADLAERIGRGRSQVTQMLSGGRNLTLRSLSDMLHALGYRLEVRTEPVGTLDR